MPRKPNPRDVIFTEILSTYAPNEKAEWWYNESYSAKNARILTTDILSAIVQASISEDEDEREGLFRECQNIVWNFYAGGGTAENCTRRIFDALGIVIREDA